MDKEVERRGSIKDHELLGDKTSVDHEEAGHLGELTPEERVCSGHASPLRHIRPRHKCLQAKENKIANDHLRSSKRNSNAASTLSSCHLLCWST